MSGLEVAPVELRLRNGLRLREPLCAGGHMELYAECLHVGRGGLVEVVGARREGKRLRFGKRTEPRAFLAAGDRAALRRRGEGLAASGQEVFVTPATLTAPLPGNEAVEQLSVLWVDIDEPGQIAAARRFPRRPHMVVASGGSGGVHLYWKLSFPIPAAVGEAANRMLAAAVGGDHVSANRGRILRLPGTLNGKRSPAQWCRVVMCDLAKAPYDQPVLCAGLTDPLEEVPQRMRGPLGRRGVEELEGIEPAVYFRAIAGIAVPRDGFVSCPSPRHRDRNPSCKVYPEPGQGWHCLAGDTVIMTWDGQIRIGEVAGTTQRLLTTRGRWRNAPVRSFGLQRPWRLALSRNGVEKEILATAEHRWFLRRRSGRVERRTTDLRAGDVLWRVSPQGSPRSRGMTPNAFGIARGFVFGDGTRDKKGSAAYFYGEKDQAMLRFFSEPNLTRHKVTRAKRAHGLPAYFKELPSLDEAPAYLYGWLSGYFAADGCVDLNGEAQLHSADREHLEFVRVLCDRLGIGTFGISRQRRDGWASAGSRRELYAVRFMRADLSDSFFALPRHRERFENQSPAYARRRWQVRHVEKTSLTDEVYCAVVDGTHAFALEDNILTGNCYACGRGGSAVDLASVVEGGPCGLELRGEAFKEARLRARGALGLADDITVKRELIA